VHRETGHRLGEARTLLLLGRILCRRGPAAAAQANAYRRAAADILAACGASHPAEVS
jgi:hypothetical protein